MRRATDALEEIFFVFTPEGDIIEWNHRVNEVAGYTDEEISQMHPTDLVPAEDTELIQKKIAQVLEEGGVRFEGRLQAKDGWELPYEFTGSLIEYEGEPLICGTGRNITERKQAQEDREASERRYRRLFEDSQEGIMITTPEGEILQANAAAEEILGYSREELQALNAEELYANPEERKAVASELKEEGAIEKREFRFERADGQEIVCEVSGAIHLRGGQERWEAFFRDVTERKETEEALRESEEWYRRLFEGAQEGIAITSPEGDIVDANPAALEIFRYSREEIRSMNTADLYVDPEERKAAVEELQGEGSLQRKEFRLQRGDGKEIICEVSSTVRRGPGGEIKALQGFFRDVTERKEAEEALRESEALHRAVLANLTETVLITDEEGHFTYVCPNVHFIFGYSAEEVSSYGDIQSFLPELEPDPSTAKDAGEVSNLECRVTDKEGQEHVLLVNARQVEIDQGSVLYSCRDITERKRAEEALQESEEQFRTLAEGALVGIVLIGKDGYQYVNPAMERITGYQREELLGKSPKRHVHPGDWPEVNAQLERQLNGKDREAHYDTRFQTKSGETRFIEATARQTTYQGEVAVIGTVQDVTEQRRLQREILQIQEEERRRLGQDLHDSLASRLTGANIKLNLISGKAKETVEESIEEAQALIEESTSDVRHLSRGLNPGGLSEGDLLSALKELAQNTEAASFEAEGPLNEGALNDAASSLESDTATHLYRIAQEATRNAQKYAEASKIEIRLRQEGGILALEIEDDGTGFNPSETKGSPKGSPSEEGLGLRSMRRRAELLGGKLKVDSSPGEGTLVRCRLPASMLV